MLYLYHEGFSDAIAGYLNQEKAGVLEELELMQAESPFRQNAGQT